MKCVTVFSYMATVICFVGCAKQNRIDTRWSEPVRFSQTEEGLAVTFHVHRWNKTLLALRYGLTGRNGEFDCWALKQDATNWQETTFHQLDSLRPVIIDPTMNRLVFSTGEKSDKEVKLTLRTVSLDESLHPNTIASHDLVIAPPLLREEFVYGAGVAEASGMVNNSEYFVPYDIETQMRHGNLMDLVGSNSIGLFLSSDSGLSWQQTNVLYRPTTFVIISILRNDFYFLGWHQWGFGGDLWFSKQMPSQFSPESEVLIKTCAGGFVTANTDDTIHLCWLDSRHENIPLQINVFLFGAEEKKNYEVFYRHVNDSNDKWGRETLVSKGLSYAYAPTISAEGKKVVIAWAGVKKSEAKYHDDYSLNDIYYAVSKDNGDTWSEPIRVTDNIPQGRTAGRPQVILLNNVIHLFYIEGKYHKNPSVSGLSLIKQPPWDIIYQQRPFPD